MIITTIVYYTDYYKDVCDLMWFVSCRVRSGHSPFSSERPAGDQTEQRRRRGGGLQEIARRSTEAAGAHTAAVFAGPEAFLQDVCRRRPTAVVGGRDPGPTTAGRRAPGGRVAGQRPVQSGRQARVAADLADPAEPVAQGGGEGRIRPHAGPHRVPGNEPGRRRQVCGEAQRQLQASQRHQSQDARQVPEHAGGAAKGPHRGHSPR